jgi:hypothetical protein
MYIPTLRILSYKTEDYKISAVKYYLNNDKGDGYKKTCKNILKIYLLF